MDEKELTKSVENIQEEEDDKYPELRSLRRSLQKVDLGDQRKKCYTKQTVDQMIEAMLGTQMLPYVVTAFFVTFTLTSIFG